LVPAKLFASILIATLLAGQACLAEEQNLKVLLMGLVDNRLNPLRDWLSAEPGISFTMVPTRIFRGSWAETHGTAYQDEMRRFIRIYFPRSYDELESYQVVLFSSIITTMYTDTQLDWLHRAIRDGGCCAIADTGGMMGKSPLLYVPWAESVVSEAFPCDADATAALFKYGDAPNIASFKVRLNRNVSEPVFTPFLPYGLERWRGASGRFMVPQEGSVIWGWMYFPQQLGRQSAPWVLSWRYGNGFTWSIADSPRYPFWSRYEVGWSDNDFGMDMWFNMMYLGAGKRLITDVALVHNARSHLRLYRESRQSLLSTLDFIQSFGARIDSLLGEVAIIDRDAEEGRAAYTEQRYEDTCGIMERCVERLNALLQRAVEVKRKALLWIYAIEWLSVTGVFMGSSVVLYSLLIRRRLYKEAGVTRVAGRGRVL